jgi:hypothetical protein
VARSFVISPRVAWPDSRHAETLATQVSLENLVRLGERVQRDSIELQAVGPLRTRYGAGEGDGYRVVLAVHPDRMHG